MRVTVPLLVASLCLILTSHAARQQPSAAAAAAKVRPQAIQPQTVKQSLKKQKVTEEDKDSFPPPHVSAQEARRLDVMVPLAGGDFLMGVRDHTSKTGEHPLRHVSVRPFKIDKYPVTNANFERFLTMKRKYTTSAEMTGWSWVFFSRAPRDVTRNHTLSQPDDPWWFKVPSASWKKVHGKDEVKEMAKALHPVVHISYYDASAFCYAIGKRLPTEHEWEFAARGGLQGQRYPWGENWQKNRSNVWQGLFPQENKKLDGYDGLAPVNAFRPQNNYGLYDMVGNVWEWTSSLYTVDHTTDARRLRDIDALYVVKGGSFVDSRDGTSNLEARAAARKGLPPSYTAENVGFRCAQSLEGAKTIAKPPSLPRLPYVHEPPVAEKGPRKPRVHAVEETWAFKVKKTIANFLLPSGNQPDLPHRPWSMRHEEL